MSELKTIIDANIKENGNQEITGKTLNYVLNEIAKEVYQDGDFNAEGNYPLLHVGTADDLAGRGESVPAEFGFRASGGKSIKDGRAYIKAIKGNSLVWNQYIDNTLSIGKFKSGNNSNTSLSVVGNVFRLTTLVQSNIYAYYRTNEFVKSLIVGHKYLRLATIINNTSGDAYFKLVGIEGDTTTVIASNTKGMFYNIFSLTNVSVTSPYLSIERPSSNVDEYIEFSNVQFIDLTKMFQAGNEPTTIEDFYARVATLGVDLNTYNEGEVIHCNTESIKSVGDNAWDGTLFDGYVNDNTGAVMRPEISGHKCTGFVRVLPNMEYYIGTDATSGKWGAWYDKDENYISGLRGVGPHKSPSNAAYMRMTIAYNNDGNPDTFGIYLVHSGWKQDTDAGYQPYWADILPLPIIRKYFPNGMKSAGTAHDEIRYNKETNRWKAVQRLKAVKMKDMNVKLSSDSLFYVSLSDIKLPTTDAERLTGILSNRYDISASAGTSGMGDKTMLRFPTGTLYIKDLSYTDASSLKASFNEDDILCYELAEPIVTEITEDFRDYYNVADFGTEMSQSSVPSAPFSADIIYQFNAVDMIREHELEITELQAAISAMQAQLASLTNS